MGLKGKVIGGAVALAIGVGGYLSNDFQNERYARSHEPITGTVLTEQYKNQLSPNPEFNGLVSYSNEPVKLDSRYTLKIKTDEGKILGVSIIDGGNVKKESLDALIGEGTRISFPRGRVPGPWRPYLDEETLFEEDTQVGTKRADRITILNQE